jgi:hypothetical protein
LSIKTAVLVSLERGSRSSLLEIAKWLEQGGGFINLPGYRKLNRDFLSARDQRSASAVPNTRNI